MTPHDKRQAVRLSIIQGLFDVAKQEEQPKSFRHNQMSNLEDRTFNFINQYRTAPFQGTDMDNAAAIIDIINSELATRYPDLTETA